MGQNRTVAQIERRVQDLALYLEINHSDDEGEGNVADMSGKKPLRLDDDDGDADSVDATGATATASNTMSFNERLKAFYDSDEEDDDGMRPSMLRKRRSADGEGGADDSRKKKLQKKVSRIRRSVGGISDSDDDDDLFGGDNDKSGSISDDDMETGAAPSLLSQASLKGGLTIPVARTRNVMIDSDDEL